MSSLFSRASGLSEGPPPCFSFFLLIHNSSISYLAAHAAAGHPLFSWNEKRGEKNQEGRHLDTPSKTVPGGTGFDGGQGSFFRRGVTLCDEQPVSSRCQPAPAGEKGRGRFLADSAAERKTHTQALYAGEKPAHRCRCLADCLRRLSAAGRSVAI